jgi:hypothetical protein
MTPTPATLPGATARLPPYVICAGLPGSASTWALNVVLQLIGHWTGAEAPAPIYIDETPTGKSGPQNVVLGSSLQVQTTAEVLDGSDTLVIKSHSPGPVLLRLARATGSPVIVTVRDPRDAICSMMMRFGARFATCLPPVTQSARILARLDYTVMLLRYEDEFFDRIATVEQIAALIGMPVDMNVCERIATQLSPENVTRQLKGLEASGVFDPARPPGGQFDPRTHWHPKHVGDRRSGKWRERISAAENADIMRLAWPFIDRFGYSTEQSPVSAGATLQFRAGQEGIGWLRSGFSEPEDWGTWTCEHQAVLRIALAKPVAAWLSLQFDCRLGPSLRLSAGAYATISVNGRCVYWTSSPQSADPFLIPLLLEGQEVAGRDSIDIAFSFAGLRPAREVTDTTDSRALGFGLVALTLEYG